MRSKCIYPTSIGNVVRILAVIIVHRMAIVIRSVSFAKKPRRFRMTIRTITSSTVTTGTRGTAEASITDGKRITPETGMSKARRSAGTMLIVRNMTKIS
ncbi:MAG: hypothetical protein G01um101477_248 [Candidatus Doudnabacteria bacterium Gr01-1014_77]|uniref:Uncharacterized protein n=1 Tax=Candidatus Doudnabacteria bacterium Gr01-1014_77 TaxID=2017133 RepID=A0A554JCE7_9BACT|nr:MAG: hypothetical protein G01um101477_248 [Candidatus Doudnabacteria bacterium Gr01-1014_77]